VVLLLQRLGLSGVNDNSAAPGTKPSISAGGLTSAAPRSGPLIDENNFKPTAQSQGDIQPAPTLFDMSSVPYSGRVSAGLEPRQNRPQPLTTFSPFSPELHLYKADPARQESVTLSNPELHFPKSYALGYATATFDINGSGSTTKKNSPASTRPPSASTPSYPTFIEGVSSSFPSHRSLGRLEGSLSRPGSALPSSRSDFDGQEQEVMQDFNGTLSSLDLDQSWRGPLESMAERPTRN
jgi:hypothetical protein